MIAYIGILVLAAFLIAFWVWMRRLERGYLSDLAARVRNAGSATDPWEEPRIVKSLGGIHDVEGDIWT